MASKHRRFFTCTLLFAGSMVYNSYLINYPVGIYDEGLILAGASRVLKGQLPYLDFWTMYPPGQFFTLAFLFKLFGTSILTERVYDILIRSLLSILIYVNIRKLGLSNTLAVTGFGIALIYLGGFGFPAYPIYPAILLILVGVYFIAHHIETNKPYYLIYAGILITTASFFRHDLAGMAAISVFFTLFLRKSVEKKIYPRSTLSFIFGLLLLGLPASIYLAHTIGIPLIADQLLFTPAKIMPKYRWLPYPTSLSFSSVQFYVYPIILFAGLIASLFITVRLKIHNSLSYSLFLLSLIGILFLNQARVRSDSIHLAPAVLISIIIGLGLFYLLYKSTIKTKLGRISSYLLMAMLVVPLAKPVYYRFSSINYDFSLPRNSLPLSGYARVSADLHNLILYIRENTKKNDAIYVGVSNHDRFIISDPIIYFLSNRPFATKYHELHPGVTNTLNIQNDIIQDIENASAKVIVLASRWWPEPNETKIDYKIDCLDNYIRKKYLLTQTFGSYKVWTRKSSEDVAQSGKGWFLSSPPHTTLHAAPHRAG